MGIMGDFTISENPPDVLPLKHSLRTVCSEARVVVLEFGAVDVFGCGQKLQSGNRCVTYHHWMVSGWSYQGSHVASPRNKNYNDDTFIVWMINMINKIQNQQF